MQRCKRYLGCQFFGLRGTTSLIHTLMSARPLSIPKCVNWPHAVCFCAKFREERAGVLAQVVEADCALLRPSPGSEAIGTQTVLYVARVAASAAGLLPIVKLPKAVLVVGLNSFRSPKITLAPDIPGEDPSLLLASDVGL